MALAVALAASIFSFVAGWPILAIWIILAAFGWAFIAGAAKSDDS